MTACDESNLVSIPVPIRPGLCAQIRIPHDLTKEEAEKIARMAMALAVVETDGVSEDK